MAQHPLLVRMGRVLARARSRQRRRPVERLPRFASFLVVVSAGLMIAVSARLSGGSDLRPTRNDDLAGVVRSQAQRNAELTRQAQELRGQVQQLSGANAPDASASPALEEAAARAGLTAVKGPAVKVTLTDAPLEVQPVGIDEDLLVVHQQDIQTVVNVLWQGGAEAMTIQGQRVVATTGVKCVGNTVLLHGVPYAPPYEITAIGDQKRLRAALADSHQIGVYRQYVAAYHLGWKVENLGSVTMPAYQGSVELDHASAPPR